MSPAALAPAFSPAEEEMLIPAVEADGSLSPIGKIEAHRTGQLHLAVSVFVFDPRRRLLLQRRAAKKYHCPGMWANTCCTHPHWGEDLEVAAHRRTAEELGFDIPLQRQRTIDYRTPVGNGLVEHERVTMFTAVTEADTVEVRPNPNEVDAFDWLTVERIRQKRDAGAIVLAPWFAIYLERYPDLRFD